MNTIDEELIDRLRAELDSLTADISGAPPGLPTVSLASVVAMPLRRDRRRVLVLAAAMIALIGAVAALVAIRHDNGAVGSPDSSPDTASVVTLAAAPVSAHPIPLSPEGWDPVEWGNVRLSLPADMSPFHTGNGCVANTKTDLEIVCGDESVRISTAPTDAATDDVVNGLHAARVSGECIGCQTMVLPELASAVTVHRRDDDAANAILDSVGPSGAWRYGNEKRPTPPDDWATVRFQGVSIRYPSDWRVQAVAEGAPSPCPPTVLPNTVLLDSGIPGACDGPGLVAPTDGVRLYVAQAPLDFPPGWPEQIVGSGRALATFVVARVGYGVDPNIGLAILSSFTDVSPETSSTYATVPAAEVPHFAVGESVMLGAKSDLDARGIQTIAAEAADWKLVLGELQQAKSEFHITDGIVLQLGTDGTVSRRQYDAVLTEVSDLPRVVVMTVKADRPWIQANNEIIRSLPLTHPNVVVLDWEARAAEVADHLASDGIHLGDDVAKAFYTNLILEALGLPTS